VSTGGTQAGAAALLELRDLCTVFQGEDGLARAVDGVDLRLAAGETLGLVGESGCGKSVTALSVLRLLPSPPGKILRGQVLFRGQDLLALKEDEMRRIRGNEISMIFQEPMTALNPVYTIGEQVGEAIRLHQGLGRRAARARAIEALARVHIPSPERRVDDYPHQLSGGMRQRVMIAMAVSCNPSILIADEPTTALDVTIQAQILDLIGELRRSTGMGVLLITHDLGVVAENADQVAVMYAGRVVEEAPVTAIFERPRHPYTLGLFRSLPDRARPGERLATIPGIVPSATRYPSGCRFRTRCPIASERCASEVPSLEPVPGGLPAHRAACHHLEEALAL
jgi:oligopeptide/dipeptide ABC transporter ATP-binding protein